MGNTATTPIVTLEQDLKACFTPEQALDVAKLQAIWKKWSEARCDIAVLGQSGAGKSTLINRLLGVSVISNSEIEHIKEEIAKCAHTNPSKCGHYYAPTGSSECTDKATPYTIAGSMAYLWDLPGFGAEKHRDVQDYWEKLNINQYNAFLYVFWTNRKTKNDEEAVRFIVDKEKPVLWVRSYFDSALLDEMDSHAIDMQRKEVLDFLDKFGLQNPKLFCVSGRYKPYVLSSRPYLFDLDKLKVAIMDTVPDAVKLPLARIFHGYSQDLIEAKFELAQKYITIRLLVGSTLGAATSIVPFVGLAVILPQDSMAQKLKKKIAKIYGFKPNAELIHPPLGVLSNNELATILWNLERDTSLIAYVSTRGVVATMLLPIVGPLLFTAFVNSDISTRFYKINCAYRDAALAIVHSLNK